MSEQLLLEQRCLNTIQLGESHFREFKSALEGPEGAKKPRQTKKICQDIGEALVAFANADGGELLIGVEDDRAITGVLHTDAQIKEMLAAPQTHVHSESVLPIATAVQLSLDGKRVLFFAVSKGTTEIYQLPDGRCVRRKDKATVPENIKRIQFERQEVKSREYDRQFVDGATVTDLDVPSVQAMANTYLAGLSVELYLQQVGLAEYTAGGIRLRRAALLLFARDINRWHPRCQTRILKIAGTELRSGEHYNVLSDETVHGNIFSLLVQSWERLRLFLAYKTDFGTDAKFEQRYIYPEQACREALVNAIAHRDYSIQNGIDVFIYNDRMEIKSPGALLSTLSVGDLVKLQGEHESRNSLIARILREAKYMRELGEGMRRIFESLEASEQEQPQLYSNGSWFSITLVHRSVFSEKQQQWLDLFKEFDLSRLQKKIVVLGMDGRAMSQDDIYKAMNTDDRDTYDREVTSLRNSEILVPTLSQIAATKIAKAQNTIRRKVPRFKVQAPATSPASPIVYIGNLPFEVTEQSLNRRLTEALKGTGEVISLRSPRRGFAFATLDSIKSAERVIRELDNTVFEGRTLTVHWENRRGRTTTRGPGA